MLSIDVDSHAKTMRFSVLLKGEVEPITIEIRDYLLFEDPDGPKLRFGELSISRLWLETLAQTLFPQKTIPLPQGAAAKLLPFIL